MKIVKRDISGILLLDKPIGLSSNEALQIVKRLFKAKKAGHTGSLDPMASGMLPICFGEATKFSQFLLEADKSYLVTGKLGEITSSGDSETPVIEKRTVKQGLSHAEIEGVLNKFRGNILQIPPMYSALKHQGQPLYKLARQGIDIERAPRGVVISKLDLVDYQDHLITLDISCSKGTYVRTLIVDIGEALGCGACSIALRRLVVGPYRADQMVQMDTIEKLASASDYNGLDKLLYSIDSMLDYVPAVKLTPDMLHYIRLGNPILVPNAPVSGLVRLYCKNDLFYGIGEVLADGRVAPKRLIAS